MKVNKAVDKRKQRSSRQPSSASSARVNAAKDKARRFGLRLQGSVREGVVVVMLALCIFLLLALFSYQPADPGWSYQGPETGVSNWMGPVGAWLADVLYSLLGASALWWPGMFGYSAWWLIRSRQVRFELDPVAIAVHAGGLVLLMFGTTMLGALHFYQPDSVLPYASGGILGEGLVGTLRPLIGSGGVGLVAAALMLIGFPLFSGVSWLQVADETGRRLCRVGSWLGARRSQRQAKRSERAASRAAGKAAAQRVKERAEREHAAEKAAEQVATAEPMNEGKPRSAGRGRQEPSFTAPPSEASDNTATTDTSIPWEAASAANVRHQTAAAGVPDEADPRPAAMPASDLAQEPASEQKPEQERAFDGDANALYAEPPESTPAPAEEPVASAASAPASAPEPGGAASAEPVSELEPTRKPAPAPTSEQPEPKPESEREPEPEPEMPPAAVPQTAIYREPAIWTPEQQPVAEPAASQPTDFAASVSSAAREHSESAPSPFYAAPVDTATDEPMTLRASRDAESDDGSIRHENASVTTDPGASAEASEPHLPAAPDRDPAPAFRVSSREEEAISESQPISATPRYERVPEVVPEPVWNDDEEADLPVAPASPTPPSPVPESAAVAGAPSFSQGSVSQGSVSQDSASQHSIAEPPVAPPAAPTPERRQEPTLSTQGGMPESDNGPTLWTVEHLQNQRPAFETLEEPEGEVPSLQLLTPPEPHEPNYSDQELADMAELLEVRLRDYGVKAEVVDTWPGPVITRFEIKPAPGVKVSKISNLAKDLARSLMVKSVRVVEVIPGRPTVGIEIPNPHRAMIRLREVIDSERYQQESSPLTMALGQDIGGGSVVANLGKMPHLLVAGTTGSGKSVGVNAMLISMLLKAKPDELKLIMVDPKMLELSVYDGIPHLLAPVVTDMKEAANSLRWCVAEMERRYKLMAAMGVRNIAGFNARLDEAERAGAQVADPLWEPQPWEMHQTPPILEKLPYIVVVIDEFADMFMIVGKKVEELIARLAQKARAAGIHLILATQRPSVDVVTGLIKANIPSRMAFQVSSRIDSRTILDQGGAESLLGHGDMLYLPAGSGPPNRVHGAFVDDDEVHRVVEDWKRRGEPEYIDEILSGGVSADALAGLEAEGVEGDDAEQDALYDEAVQFVTETRKASISAVQRRFKIGYNRAARLVDSMEAAGVVSTMGTNGQREVLAPPPVGN